MLYIIAMDNISKELKKKASQVSIPDVLYNYALQTSKTVGEFLHKIVEMNKWDASECEAFFNKYPGLRPDNKEEL